MPAMHQRSVVVSIHAPVKGATRRIGLHRRCALCFNPRSREGSDRDFRKIEGKAFSFNPRSREGSDVMALLVGAENMMFQSTLP